MFDLCDIPPVRLIDTIIRSTIKDVTVFIFR